MISRKLLAVVTASVTLVLALSACGGAKSETPNKPHNASPSPTQSATPAASAEPLAFTMPTECKSLVPKSRIAEFDEQGLILLGGPDGKYGDEYLADATPEQQLDGVSCIWGSSDSEISSVTVSVAPLSPATRPTVIDSFAAQGLNEQATDTATSFYLEGDREIEPAIVNMLQDESWISVITTVGGAAAYADAVKIVEEVRQTVYAAS